VESFCTRASQTFIFLQTCIFRSRSSRRFQAFFSRWATPATASWGYLSILLPGVGSVRVLVLARSIRWVRASAFITQGPTTEARGCGGPGAEHDTAGKQMLLTGDTCARLQVWDAVRSVYYVANQALCSTFITSASESSSLTGNNSPSSSSRMEPARSHAPRARWWVPSLGVNVTYR
jgi:hypothetical protein